jgi:hypothetical protein
MSEEATAGDDGRFSRRQLLLGGGALTVFVFAIAGSEGGLFGEEAGIERLLERHLDALEAGDRAAYRETLAPDSPVDEAEIERRIEGRPARIDLFVGAVERDGDTATAETVLDYYEEVAASESGGGTADDGSGAEDESQGSDENDSEGRTLVRTYECRRDDEWLIYDWETTEERPLEPNT